ncbi:hypothetical protein RDWZM_000836 [Blomia tropicalis]|uniref:Transmembrane protein adipocyte-associated 1 homolog n=1 Tax=Blomia tropicalis TaxID=40697 RepID=A0A9Q0RQ20_BLOTA|nr:Transmembrane protein adipocyte-associated 1 [Blomia tropicalis]KAJ6222291.1 hypothetical protein RDWZM_000836 [Blomia tropicalis]
MNYLEHPTLPHLFADPIENVVNYSNGSNSDDTHICKVILYTEIRDTSIRVWDAAIFIPNFTFLVYLLLRFKVSRERINALNSYPILRNFYVFIYLCVTVSIMRCFISVVMKVHTTGGDLTDKIFWVIVRFFLLSTEISVLVFGLFSGHLDVRQSIRRILSITLFVSLVYSVCQGTFEIIAPDASFYIASKDYYLYGHGGMFFWFCTCMLSFFVYLGVVLLPWIPCRNRLLLPTKQSFYIYAGILATLNIIQAIGAISFNFNRIEGLCIVDATTYLYFTLFTPLVYCTFLSPFLQNGSSNSGASALVTTTAGAETRTGCRDTSLPQPPPALNRPTNLFTSGLRGAVNFSYRPQVDDDLLDADDDFPSVGSTSGFGSGNGPGLQFDHYGPYAYNQPRQGYLVYGGGGGPGVSMNQVPRSISMFSFQSNIATPMASSTDQSATPFNGQETTLPINPSSGKTNRLLESHMLQEQMVDDHTKADSPNELQKVSLDDIKTTTTTTT